MQGGGLIMDKKMKECFQPHVMMHSLVGLGLGVFLVSLVPGLGLWWLGLGLVLLAVVLDMMRK